MIAAAAGFPWRLVGKVAIAAVLVAALWHWLPVTQWTLSAVEYLRGAGASGYAMCVGVYVVAGLLGAPRTPLNVAAGLVFPFASALAVVLGAAFVTYFLTFSIARYFARPWIERRLRKVPNAAEIMQAVDEEGFKLVFLIRMNPFIPAVLKGYGFGTTQVPLFNDMSASALGFLPLALAHTYLGWAGGTAFLRGEDASGMQTYLLISGVVVNLVLAGFMAWYAKRRMQKRFTSVAPPAIPAKAHPA